MVNAGLLHIISVSKNNTKTWQLHLYVEKFDGLSAHGHFDEDEKDYIWRKGLVLWNLWEP